MDTPVIGSDWLSFLYPALRLFLSGVNPYTYPPLQHEIGQPPWLFLIVAPLALLPPTMSMIGINLISATGLAAFFVRNKKKWLALAAAISFPFMVLLAMGNLDGLPLWGLVIGGPIGLILLMIKPQAGILIGVIWAIKAWKKGGWKALAVLIGPVAVLIVLSLIIFPQWLTNMLWFSSRVNYESINAFPWLAPLGIALFIAAIRREREDWAAVATILISPYVRVQSWIVPVCLLLVSYPLEGSIISVATWLPHFMTRAD